MTPDGRQIYEEGLHIPLMHFARAGKVEQAIIDIVGANVREAVQAQLNRYEYHQIEMGVSFRIVLYACDEASANQAAKAAYTHINKLNHILT